MKVIQLAPTHPAFLEEVVPDMPRFGEADYRQRLDLLAERMSDSGLSHAVVYADREHFANMEYLIGFEPRFEESLFIMDDKGNCTLLVGNECMSYSFISPIPMKRILYQNFSLQGQPRDKIRPLRSIFADLGIGQGTRIGLVGFKYFEVEHALGETEEVFDVPAFILHELQQAGPGKVVSFTRVMTGLPDGIRMTIRTAKEVAWAEYAACKATRVIQRMLVNMKPGITELALSETGGLDFSPVSVFPMANFGKEHGAIGLRSPTQSPLQAGDPCGFCYAIRGSLVARFGIAAFGEDSLRPEYNGVADGFLKPFWQAVAAWYESLSIGASAGDVYDSVMDIIGEPKFGVTLNPGHYIGGDEWVNSPFHKGSAIRLNHSAHLQSDIIASSSDPAVTGICEDGIILADEALRRQVAQEYPDVWARITGRQERMRKILGINISDDVLPLGNLNGVYYPYMLNTGLVFSKSAET